jgi:hypothetical protein
VFPKKAHMHALKHSSGGRGPGSVQPPEEGAARGDLDNLTEGQFERQDTKEGPMPYPYALVFQTVVLPPEAPIEGELDNIDPQSTPITARERGPDGFVLTEPGRDDPQPASRAQSARVRSPTRPF